METDRLEARIRNIELFIFYLVILIASYDLIVNKTSFVFIENFEIAHPWIILIYLGALMFSFAKLIDCFILIFVDVIQYYTEKTQSYFLTIYNKHRSNIGYVIIILSTILAVVVLRYLDFSWKSILGAMVFEVLFGLFINWKKIVNHFKKEKN